MRKIIFLISTVLALTIFPCGVLATDLVDSGTTELNNTVSEENNQELVETENEHNETEELNGASDEIIGAVSKKDKKIAELSDKYNDKFLGTVAYYLDVIRYYSTPIFFIFLTIGAFNFFIVGNKKLDKKEQGFGWITACIIGWVVFQCIPLVFSLFAI